MNLYISVNVFKASIACNIYVLYDYKTIIEYYKVEKFRKVKNSFLRHRDLKISGNESSYLNEYFKGRNAFENLRL